MKDSNQEVQDRITLIFSAFLELGSVGKVIRSLRDRALTVPRRDRFGDVVWRVPTASMLTGMLKNPAYAGAAPGPVTPGMRMVRLSRGAGR
ncbi:recombinase family protein [Mesorhizobium sp.]|uniref:recombinase family protein n=1 Tax=Mesorhizobium sp. TaxID=1871066 RepID=UPI000FE75070|nr:recombinase family protein [Mesorhizobium sp.]RWE28418.1 MAG: hypothetical protein EOS77_26150 [Mesorhizobium sp.]